VIVVDSNVIVYCWVSGAKSSVAQRVRVADPGWQVPLLWRSEVRNSLAGFMRYGSLSPVRARAIMGHIEDELVGSEHLPSSDSVLNVVERSRLSAYDSEFVALAEDLGVVLVTEDKAVLKAFASFAVSMERFLTQ
jgi:predicted nucleic acid-binding protein